MLPSSCSQTHAGKCSGRCLAHIAQRALQAGRSCHTPSDELASCQATCCMCHSTSTSLLLQENPLRGTSDRYPQTCQVAIIQPPIHPAELVHCNCSLSDPKLQHCNRAPQKLASLWAPSHWHAVPQSFLGSKQTWEKTTTLVSYAICFSIPQSCLCRNATGPRSRWPQTGRLRRPLRLR